MEQSNPVEQRTHYPKILDGSETADVESDRLCTVFD